MHRELRAFSQSLLGSAQLRMRCDQLAAVAPVRQFTNCRILRGGTLLRSGLRGLPRFGLVKPQCGVQGGAECRAEER